MGQKTKKILGQLLALGADYKYMEQMGEESHSHDFRTNEWAFYFYDSA